MAGMASPALDERVPGSGRGKLDVRALFAGGLLHEAHHRSLLEHRSPVGAGLLANAVGHSISMLADTPSSRASPLPHWIFCPNVLGLYKTCGAVVENHTD